MPTAVRSRLQQNHCRLIILFNIVVVYARRSSQLKLMLRDNTLQREWHSLTFKYMIGVFVFKVRLLKRMTATRQKWAKVVTIPVGLKCVLPPVYSEYAAAHSPVNFLVAF